MYNVHVLVGVGSVGKKLKEGSMTCTQGQRLTCLIPFAMVLHLFHLFTTMVGKHENNYVLANDFFAAEVQLNTFTFLLSVRPSMVKPEFSQLMTLMTRFLLDL